MCRAPPFRQRGGPCGATQLACGDSVRTTRMRRLWSFSLLMSTQLCTQAGAQKPQASLDGEFQKAKQEARYSLTSRQQGSLAQLVHFTLEKPGFTEETERVCLEDLVRVADQLFTGMAPDSVLSSMWSTDDGVSPHEVASLRERLSESLSNSFEGEASCAQAGLDEEQQRVTLKRISSALTRACQLGNSANFKVMESAADQILRFLSPSVEYSNFMMALLMLLAAAGAFVLTDSLLSGLLLGRSLMGRTTVRAGRKRVPCQCRMCEGYVERGRSIGQGGFGQVYLCKVMDDVVDRRTRKRSSSGKAYVVKMIPVDLEHDLNVLQDALDEAKNLITLQHPHIVRYHDVFVHRDDEASKRLVDGDHSDDNSEGSNSSTAEDSRSAPAESGSRGGKRGVVRAVWNLLRTLTAMMLATGRPKASRKDSDESEPSGSRSVHV